MADDNDGIPRKNVAMAAVTEGAKNGVLLAGLNGGINIAAQSFYLHPPKEPLLKKLFTVPENFRVNGGSLKEALAFGAIAGTAIGAVFGAVNAVRYNREAQQWADREEAINRSLAR